MALKSEVAKLEANAIESYTASERRFDDYAAKITESLASIY
jgi:hypothetical protein